MASGIKNSVMYLFLLFMTMVIYGSDEPNNADEKQLNAKNDPLHCMGLMLTQHIQRFESKLLTKPLMCSLTAARDIYQQTTTSGLCMQFNGKQWKVVTQLQSEYVRSFPVAVDGSKKLQKISDTELQHSTTAPFQYVDSSNQRRVFFVINADVSNVEIAFHNTRDANVNHLVAEYTSGVQKAQPRIEFMSIVYHNDRLQTIDLSSLTHTKFLVIQPKANLKTLILPRKVETFVFNSERVRRHEQEELSIVATQISRALTINSIPILSIDLTSKFIGNALQFDGVHIMKQASIKWPTTALSKLFFSGGIWPEEGLDLSAILSVNVLKLTHTEEYSPNAIKKTKFPTTVNTLELGKEAERMIQHMSAKTLATHVRAIKIHGATVDRPTFITDCLPTLLEAMRLNDRTEEGLEIKINSLSAKEWMTINIFPPSHKTHSLNVKRKRMSIIHALLIFFILFTSMLLNHHRV